MRVVPRKVEGTIGGQLLHFFTKKQLKDSGLVKKSITINIVKKDNDNDNNNIVKTSTNNNEEERTSSSSNQHRTTTTIEYPEIVHYYERDGIDPPILFCHGLADEAKNFAGFIHDLKLPNRILVPDAIGHGEDIQRFFVMDDWDDNDTGTTMQTSKTNKKKKHQVTKPKKEGTTHHHHHYRNYHQKLPTPEAFLLTTEAFLVALNISTCHAFGYSMGGALVYFLKYYRPDLIQKTILLAPSIEICLDDNFITSFQNGTKNHFCFESRTDAKILFRDLSIPNRIKQNPIPKFFLQAIYEDQIQKIPHGHYRYVMESLLATRGTVHKEFPWLGCPKDIDPHPTTDRLVVWPKHDFICNPTKGKSFFQDSTNTKFHTIPECGHMFLSDGTPLLQHIIPMVSEYFMSSSSSSRENGKEQAS